MTARRKVGVLISGRGSNLQALLDACEDESFPAQIAVVISNRPEAAGLERAATAGIPHLAIDHRAFPDRPSFEREMTAALEAADAELVCHAGFMRILTAETVRHWHGRMINIHPSLLPLFPGLDTHERALAAGVRVHGCTVHFVSDVLDSGPIIGQAAVPVLPCDDAATLASRVLAAEHLLYPRCLALVASGLATLEGDQVAMTAAPGQPEARLINPPALAGQEESG